MRYVLGIFFLALLASACRYEQGSGNVISQQREVGEFSGVIVGGDFDVEITTGGSSRVVISADDNIIDDIHTKMDNGKLKITLKNGLNLRSAHMKASISVPSLNLIKSSASARVKLVNQLKSESKLILDASSGSRITGDVHAPITDAEASSGASLNLGGQTKELYVDASSGASIQAFDLLSETTHAETSSGASASVHASVQLDATASSGGTVKYRGNGNVNIKKSSGGNVVKE